MPSRHVERSALRHVTVLGRYGVGVLHVSRQFSIRSALICIGVVALLLRMVMAL
jgi:hypothetical protein